MSSVHRSLFSEMPLYNLYRLPDVVPVSHVLQAPNQWTPQLVSMMLIAYARNNCVSLPACQRLLTALTNEALHQVHATDCQVIFDRTHAPKPLQTCSRLDMQLAHQATSSISPCPNCCPSAQSPPLQLSGQHPARKPVLHSTH